MRRGQEGMALGLFAKGSAVKKILAFCAAALAALFLSSRAQAAASAQISLDTILPYAGPLAYSSTNSIRTDGLDWGSAQVTVTSATIAAQNFGNGQPSVGSFTVVNFTALSSATATGSITIANNAGTIGASVSGGGPGLGSFNVANPGNWVTDTSASSQTACNLAAAIQVAYSVVFATCGASGGNVVYTSATYAGSNWNNFQLSVSTYGAMTISTFVSSTTYQAAYSSMTGVGIGVLSGGQDNQSVTVNGKTLLANRDFYPVTSTGATATSLASAINASSATTNVIAQAVSGVIFTTTTIAGANTNYVLTSSSQAALSVSAPVTISGSAGSTTMQGGKNIVFALNSSVILATNTFTNGLAVLWTKGANPSPIPLVNNTTYYVGITTSVTVINGVNQSLYLATTSTGAIAGNFIVYTSTPAVGLLEQYVLTPLALTGTPLLQWLVSDDETNWVPYVTTPFNITIPSPTISLGTFYSTGTVSTVDFGHMDYGWLGLGVTFPTSGAINITAHIIGKQD